MNEPLPLAYWEAVRRLAEPFELMKFTLVFDGDLPSSGSKGQPIKASCIRNQFHDQLADLWDSHVVLRQLARTARTYPGGGWWLSDGKFPPPELPEWREPSRPLEPGQTDYCAPIQVSNLGSFIPLIRKSLYLACAVDILFLRHEEPLTLLKHGGDLDGRIKTLFDAMRMPNDSNEHPGHLTADPLYVVMEDDALISDIAVRSGRLLGDRMKKPHRVRLTVEVTVRLRVFPQNQCLIGG